MIFLNGLQDKKLIFNSLLNKSKVLRKKINFSIVQLKKAFIFALATAKNTPL